MKTFYKFHGTGNDFIMIDGRQWMKSLPPDLITQLCDRHTGIGADGLIIIKQTEGFDFEMIYFNSDGSLAKMCGNGARCSAAFAYLSGICGTTTTFLAGDGSHNAHISEISQSEWMVDVSINNVEMPALSGSMAEINTGTPHLVILTPENSSTDVMADGRKIRFSDEYAKEGININWLSISENQLSVRTYERGVEAETLSCGTGVTASAIFAALHTGKLSWKVITKGGMLWVSMNKTDNVMTNIRLKGSAKMTFKGEIFL
ncbi:MAG: diaminopimelate epimerase [Bacteroidetes bacterium HGW-Bacteroidetes-11]|jgi:diaminopimelate epimerase|nr:MAG: diaminopimelate epimerase [Bacteroidetes bacterium HGW-Bacteroidetes-11]